MLEKLNKKSIKLKLRREGLENLRRSFELKGEGTKESPVIFDVFGDFCLEFSIKIKEIYLILRNLTISRLLILNSQNIAIENCFVGNLKMVGCRNLTFRNNSVIKARQLFSRSIFFENNSVNGSRKNWSGKEQLIKHKRSYKRSCKKIAKNWN